MNILPKYHQDQVKIYYLNKKISLNDLKEKISIKTRQYAKRQSTWSRGQMSEWQKIKYSDLKTFIKKFAKYA